MRLSVDPVACEGLGMCAHLAPDVITLDPWGFPIIEARDLAADEAPAARRAVRACHRRALYETG